MKNDFPPFPWLPIIGIALIFGVLIFHFLTELPI